MLKNLTKYLHVNVLQSKNLIVKVKNESKKNLCTYKRVLSNLETQNRRFLYLNSTKIAKHFVDTENSFAHRLLESYPIAMMIPTKIEIDKIILNENEFNTFLNQNWRSATASDVTKAFLNVLNYCKNNNIAISDTRFDKLVDGLMDNVEKLTTDELYALLNFLTELPQAESFSSHNYHDMWSAIDDVCCWRMKTWNLETSFKFADAWYRLSLGRICDYVYELLEKLSRKPERLTQQQLVHTFFYTNTCRRRPIDFAMEYAVDQKILTLGIDEISIIAMGYFKSQTKVKLVTILNRMIELTIQNSHTIQDISLAAILKVIRISQNLSIADDVIILLDKLIPEIPRLTHLCSMHLAILASSYQILNKPLLEAIAQKFVIDVSNVDVVRLKDIERILLAMTMFDYEPTSAPDFYELLFKELHREERLPEKVRHPKCLPLALLFLSIRNIYSEKLLNDILDPEFTIEVYGKSSKLLPRELFSLDLSREIDLPNYNGNKWTMEMRQKAAKWLIEYLPPTQKKKLSAADKFIFDVINTANNVTGDEKYVHVGYVLPHFPKPDVILCVDKATKKFVEPVGFHNYFLGDIMRPHDVENLMWYSIVCVHFFHTSRNTLEFAGIVNMKRRHLKAIGYEPVLVLWNEWDSLQSDEKVDHILTKIKLL